MDSSVERPHRNSIVVGTAGHIDHGKTALVRALTGVDTDRLPEEKRRGITIDLGFASLQVKLTDGQPMTISFVDVPGHALFIRNMLAGTGCIDAVMLVIAADEGVKPQTQEHLDICRLLGVQRGLTVITKADAVSPDRLEQVCHEIESFLSDSFLSQARLVVVSAYAGTGIDELRGALLDLANAAPATVTGKLLRFPPDRAFVVKGSGTVVTGTLIAGEITAGQTLSLEPGGRTVRVREIQTHNQRLQQEHTGSRVALNLAGIDATEVYRGQTLLLPGSISAVETIDAEITILPGCNGLKHRARVHVHAFTADILGTIFLYGYDGAEPGAARIARIRLQKPMVLLPGDRFVLRQPSPAMTIGGGRVLDAHPLPGLRRADALQWLTEFKNAPIDEQLYACIARRDIAGLTLQQLSRETGLTSEALDTALHPLIQARRVLRLSAGVLLGSTAQRAARERVDALLEAEGRDLATKGWKRSELRSRTRLNPEVFDSVMKELSGEDRVKISGELVFSQNPRTHLRMQIGSGSLRSTQSMKWPDSPPPCRPRWQTVYPSRTPRCGDW
jgi:selenocysteine-specific elongation factor